MDIKYLGHSSFFIKGKEGKLVTDPFSPDMTGFKFPKTEADIVTISHAHKDHNYLDGISGSPIVFDWPGQYERKGMRIAGFKSFHDAKKGEERGENILFRIEDDITVLHCGDLGEIPDEGLLDEIGGVDILMVPVGNKYTLNADQAAELVKKVEPSIVIPMHYLAPGGKMDDLAPVTDFLAKYGIQSAVPVPKLTIKKEELTEEIKIVVMEPGA